MTEAEWLTATDPTPMLEFVREQASERKLRLFAVACCRRVWYLLSDECSRNAVEVAEKLADGNATHAEMLVAKREAKKVDSFMRRITGIQYQSPKLAAVLSLSMSQGIFLRFVAGNAACRTEKNKPDKEEQLKQSELLGDLFGNPFSPPHFDPSFRTSTVLALAAQMYASRDFTPMPMLADALQDAGCPDDSELIRHCRGPGPHVRGCHVLDGILGKS